MDDTAFEFPGVDEVNARIVRETGKTLAQMLEETSIVDVMKILQASGEEEKNVHLSRFNKNRRR